MRTERWWWLAAFCAVSLSLHLLGYWRSHTFLLIGDGQSRPVNEMEIALEPLPEEAEKKAPVPPVAPPEAPPPPLPQLPPLTDAARAKIFASTEPPIFAPAPVTPAPVAPLAVGPAPVTPAPVAPPPADLPQQDEKPQPPSPTVVASAADTSPRLRPTPPATPEANPVAAPVSPIPTAPPAPNVTPDDKPDLSRAAGTLAANPRLPANARRPTLTLENPLTGAGLTSAPDEKPATDTAPANATPQRLARATGAATPLAGGSPAPSAVPGGNGGARGPEAPPEDVLFNGVGAGGMKLPRVAPRTGGGGGLSVQTAINPLASAVVPDERPGAGPGAGGGAGTGTGGGVGSARGRGVGTNPNGRVALGTLRAKPGPGLGAGSGRGTGTRAPGGGRGTGSETPGTGGTGFGYGRGRGNGIGGGLRPSTRGDGGRGGGGGGGEAGGGGIAGLNRGIPFADIAGLLRGGAPGGGGGVAPGGRSGSGGGAPVHIVYLLDVSGSMNEGNKIGKAREALKKALSELRSRDTFNIVTFYGRVSAFAPDMLPATPGNLQQAMIYVDSAPMGHKTNISGAFERAFAIGADRATHLFLLSDGQPDGGIEDFDALRRMVRERNQNRARILTLALGLGSRFRGMALLKGIAEDNNGLFDYVDLSR